MFDAERALGIAEPLPIRRRVSFADSGALPHRQRHRVVDRRHIPAGHRELELAAARPLPEILGRVDGRISANASWNVYFMFGNGRIVRVQRIDRLDELRAQLVAQHGLDFLVDLVADRHVVLRVLHHELADDADAHAL